MSFFGLYAAYKIVDSAADIIVGAGNLVYQGVVAISAVPKMITDQAEKKTMEDNRSTYRLKHDQIKDKYRL
jgi:hypothetical protein